MNKIGGLLGGVLAALLLPATALADANNFRFSSFDADYYLSRDAEHISQMRVTERLVAQFPDTDQNHGILRAIPASYEDHPVNLNVQSVTDESGHAINYSAGVENGNHVLKIGDADRYVHGRQTYLINYTMSNVTANQPGYSALFWDANGDQWPQTFGQVTARVHLASDIATALNPNGTRCFTGPSGSTAQDCTISGGQKAGDETISFMSSKPLNDHETLTFELRFAADTFSPYHMTSVERRNLILLIVAFALPALGTLAFMWWRWNATGRDPKSRGVIIPEYLPPKGLSVLGASQLLTEKFETKAISAQIIDLAVRGYLRVFETKEVRRFQPDKTDYSLMLMQDPTGLLPEERAAITLFFDSRPVGSTINLSSLKNLLASQAKDLGNGVSNNLAAAGLFRASPLKAKLPYFTAGMVFLGFAAFFSRITPALALVLPGLIILAFANFMPARTAAGVTMRDYLLGLKQFITVAEADRINTLQSPRSDLTEKIDVTDKTQLVKLYERLLPYAMLFGLEQDWTKQFAPLYDTPPDWYSGTSTFNAVYFASSLSGLSAASTASFTAPSSSSSGGFSGGGGGGGGGGGW